MSEGASIAVAEEVTVTAARVVLSKSVLLDRARKSVAAGFQSFRDAAEALNATQQAHGTTQREMAISIDKSPAWVNALLKWHRAGCPIDGPFGPTTKRGRIQHAEQCRITQGSKTLATDVGTAGTKADAAIEDDVAITDTVITADFDASAVTIVDAVTNNGVAAVTDVTNIADIEAELAAIKAAEDDQYALEEFKDTVDCWLSMMTDAARREAVEYVAAKAGIGDEFGAAAQKSTKPLKTIDREF